MKLPLTNSLLKAQTAIAARRLSHAGGPDVDAAQYVRAEKVRPGLPNAAALGFENGIFRFAGT